MNFYKALKSISRYGVVNNGYTGKQAIVGIAFNPENGSCNAVCDSCCFQIGNGSMFQDSAGQWLLNTAYMNYADESEMLYHFDNHRDSKFPQIIRLASDTEIEAFNKAISKHLESPVYSIA